MERKAFTLEQLVNMGEPVPEWQVIHVFFAAADELERWAEELIGLFLGISPQLLMKIIASRGGHNLGYRLTETPLIAL